MCYVVMTRGQLCVCVCVWLVVSMSLWILLAKRKEECFLVGLSVPLVYKC